MLFIGDSSLIGEATGKDHINDVCSNDIYISFNNAVALCKKHTLDKEFIKEYGVYNYCAIGERSVYEWLGY